MDSIKDVFMLMGEMKIFDIITRTVQINSTATLIGAIIGLPLGAWLAMTRHWLRHSLIVCFECLLGLPPLLAGLCIYLLLSYKGPLGGLGWLYGPKAMILAQTLLVFPIVCALSQRVLSEYWRHFSEDLFLLGHTKPHIVMTLLYEARVPLLTVGLTGFGRALGEVGSVLIVGGNIEGVSRVLTTAIALETSQGKLDRALVLGGILMLISLTITIFLRLLGSRTHAFA